MKEREVFAGRLRGSFCPRGDGPFGGSSWNLGPEQDPPPLLRLWAGWGSGQGPPGRSLLLSPLDPPLPPTPTATPSPPVLRLDKPGLWGPWDKAGGSGGQRAGGRAAAAKGPFFFRTEGSQESPSAAKGSPVSLKLQLHSWMRMLKRGEKSEIQNK